MPPGRWVAEHVHHREQEAWPLASAASVNASLGNILSFASDNGIQVRYVLSGTLTFRISGQTIEAPTGTFVLAPRGVTHSFGNAGTGPATHLELFAPAGLEGYFEDRFALVQAARHAANADYAGLDPAVHAALAQKYGMEFT